MSKSISHKKETTPNDGGNNNNNNNNTVDKSSRSSSATTVSSAGSSSSSSNNSSRSASKKKTISMTGRVDEFVDDRFDDSLRSRLSMQSANGGGNQSLEFSKEFATATTTTTTTTNSTRLHASFQSQRSGDNDSVSIVLSLEPSILQMVSEVQAEHARGAAEANKESDCQRMRCCDLRRLCLIVDGVFLAYTVVGYVLEFAFEFVKPLDLDAIDDDGVIEDYLEESSLRQSQGFFLAVLLTMGFGMVFAVLGLFGAHRFSKGWTLAAGMGYGLGSLASLVFRNYPGAALKGLFAYPHFALFVALHQERLTRDNYETQQHCCCCGPNTTDRGQPPVATEDDESDVEAPNT